MNEIFYIFSFHTKSPKSGMYFTLKIHFNADTRLSSDMLSLYLDLMKLTMEKYTHILILFETPQLFSNN